jgi:Fe2+ or Zn2+ uptake regulation protein
MNQIASILRNGGVRPTLQRIAVAKFVLNIKSHLSADEVLEQVRRQHPTISRATVYNTLNLLADRGLVKAQILKEGIVVFDSNIERHHHFIDDDTGNIYDLPWEALKVTGEKSLNDFQVREYQVILKGKKKRK